MRLDNGDFRFSRMDIVLWCAVIVSALLVVWSTDRCRDLFTELMTLQAKENDLKLVQGRFLLQEGALGSPMRLEQMAKNRLKMRIPSSSEILVIRK